MSSKFILTFALVYAVTIDATFANAVKPSYQSCDAKCKEDWITESLESRIREFQKSTSGRCDGKKIHMALENTLVRMNTELVNEVVPASNAVAFFPLLALINLLIFIILLVIILLEGGAALVTNSAGHEPSSLDGWYIDSYNSIQQFYYSTPDEMSGCIADHVETAKCILDDLYNSLGGEGY